MNKLLVAGLGTAAVILALVVGSRVLGPPAPGGVGGAPSAAPTATPRLTATPASSTPAAYLSNGPFAILNNDPTSPVRFKVTIPASGWTASPEYAGLSKGAEVGNLPEAAILFWSWPAGTRFDVYRDPCHWATTTPTTPVTTVPAFAAGLSAQALRDASTPADVTVGRAAGKHITLHVPTDPAASTGCDQDKFASYGLTGRGELERYQQGPGQIDELWILDVDGHLAVIDATYRPDTAPALVEEMRAIATSATFQ